MNSRIKILLILTLTLFALVPVWWKTTEVYRAALPTEEIAEIISSTKDTGRIVVNLYFDSRSAYVASKIPTNYLGNNFRVNSRFLSEKVNDANIDISTLKNATPVEEDRTGSFHVFILSRSASAAKQLEMNIGHQRYAWIVVNDVANAAGKQAHDKMILSAISRLVETLFPVIDDKSVIAAKFASAYRLSFTLVVADQSYANNAWDLAILPHFEAFIRALSRVARFSVEFQVQFAAPLTMKPKFNDKTQSYHLTKTQMMSFIDSNNWNLDFGIDTLMTLNFVLYVPEQQYSPLFIDQKDIAYIVPQWGGLVIYNKPIEKESHELELERVSGLFITQLRNLFTLTTPNKYVQRISSSLSELGISSQINFNTSHCGVAEWEIDNIVFRRLKSVREKCFLTLTQFISMITKLTTLPIGDEISALLNDALQNTKMV